MRISKELFEVACARKCISSKEVIERSGISRATLSNCIRRERGAPVTIGKIAKAIGVDVTEIIDTQEVQP